MKSRFLKKGAVVTSPSTFIDTLYHVQQSVLPE